MARGDVCDRNVRDGDAQDGDANDPWEIYRDAQARMAIDEFEATPALEAAYAAFDAASIAVGGQLAVRTAVIALYWADATYEGLDTWVARGAWGVPPPAGLDRSAQAWWLAGELVRTYAEATTEIATPGTLAARDALFALLNSDGSAIDPDAFLIAVSALLEYAEFEDDGVLFDRILAEALPLLGSTAGSPLYRGRAWYRVQRCAFAMDVSRGRGAHRVNAAMAESHALAIAELHDLHPLRCTLLIARAFYANLSRDEPSAQAALLELGRITDFRRPLPAAWYYYLRGQAAARQENGTEALFQFGQSVDAAAAARAPLGAQQNFVVGHAMALLHAGRWADATERLDRLMAQQSGRDRDLTACRRALVEHHRIAAETPERAAATRAAVIARARDVRWMSFALLTPRATARFLADALRDGESLDFIGQVVVQRKLRAEPGFPRAWPWPLRIFTLGTFRIEMHGAPIVIGARPQRKQLELLALLVALGPQPAAIAMLLDALWPDADGDRAKHSLEMAVLRLRRMLGQDDLLFVTAGYVSLDRTQVWVDAWAFAEGEDLIDGGTFLAGEGGAAIQARRAHLHHLFVQRTCARGQALEDAGRAAQALALYDDALTRDGLVEALHRGVIRCQLALGERSAAIQAYRLCQDRLRAELGVEPSRATRKLLAGIDGE